MLALLAVENFVAAFSPANGGRCGYGLGSMPITAQNEAYPHRVDLFVNADVSN
ncbi:hypothetical protein CupriaWKF_01950 [Cupriavidus sp. WKF15]|uniref:hypothetical protein n=1 Tax=Cupriavidus sp. WKF15 TaxID=3032282 RepID=UPI0023E10DDB|nr:hypothetical protein [Cupriavidus sp. WKF15]WER46377.1 hypothetical protein CupriaWKF_01950 [Cupriavidus sp. WKF15]